MNNNISQTKTSEQSLEEALILQKEIFSDSNIYENK